MPVPPPVLPAAAFRIGVTGSRTLDPAAIALLRAQIGEMLDLVAAALPSASNLRLISPLAEGADRLAATEAMARNWRVVAPLPFVRHEYELDFPDSISNFRDLLTNAAVFELDGDRNQAGASYDAAGRFVVRNCDLLLAVWDGAVAHGRGGTADIVRFAAHGRVPIWWVAPDGGMPPRLIRTASELRQPDRALEGEAAIASLRSIVALMAAPPKAPPPDRPGFIGGLVAVAGRWRPHADDPLNDYLANTAWPDRSIWHLYSRCMSLIAPAPADEPPLFVPAASSLEEIYWERMRAPADALSRAHANRYRSCYLLIFLLAAAALIAAAVALAFPRQMETPMTLLELAALTAIGVVVIVNHRHRFHERWISARLLAELCRKQYVLCGLGWSLPHWEVERLAGDEIDSGMELPRETWVAWYFAAACRAAPLPTGRLSGEMIERAAELGRALAAEQISYHRIRQERSETAAHWLATAGEITFLATLALVALKLVLLLGGRDLALPWLGLICAALPAASAAFVGIRAYAEFELLAHQSARMRRELADIATELAPPIVPGPLASQNLGAQLFELSMAMLRDVRGWAQLFRMKVVGSG